jgi:peptidoglycan/LPS O-acetylase OafA/YrhL
VVESSQRALRPDIQGLRALAVGLVLLYHLWPNRLPGGFVGVDVFFVISGFLIGGHLLAEAEGTGRVRLGRFWARRARRLLPASLLVLLFVAVATAALAPTSAKSDFHHQVVGSVFYVQNWVLAQQAVDYLAIGDVPSPVQHYWSLAVEEQLYIGLPLVLAAVLWLTGRRRAALVAVLGVLCLLSFAWSVLSTQSDPGIAYFSTLTRAWEFLAGSLLAAVAWRSTGRFAGALAGLVGTAAVVASAFLLDGRSVFPGWIAVVPVLGTVLIIGTGDRSPIGLLSRWRPVTWLGDVSYAVYLWHWPLIVLVPYATDVPLTTLHKGAIVLATLVLASASTYLVEQPIQRSPRLRTGRPGRLVLVGLLAASLTIAGGSALGARSASQEQQRQLAETRERFLNGDVHCLGAAALDPQVTGCDVPADLLFPPPSSAAVDDYNRAECWATNGVSDLHLCGFGSEDPDAKRVLAVGDSHNNVYLPAYESLAAERGWHLDVAGRAGCSWSVREQDGPTRIADECNAWRDAVADHLATSEPYDLILTTSSQTGPLDIPGDGETARQATVAGHSEAWVEQIARGTLVVAIRDYPEANLDVVQCVEQYEVEAATKCARDRRDAIPRFDALVDAVSITPGSALLDLLDLECQPRSCPPVIGNVVVYREREHLTATFVRTLAPYLISRLPAAERAARQSLGG